MAAHEQDDKLHLQVALGALHVAMERLQALQERNQTLQHKGSITIAMTNFAEKKDANSKTLFPPFYTHPHGYHLAPVVYANGCNEGEGTHVAVGVEIMKGKYDADLKWPFDAHISLTLLNQCSDQEHVTKGGFVNELVVPLEQVEPKFISHPELFNPAQNTQYLKDDTLYFRVSVAVADHKPWLDCILNEKTPQRL